MLIAEKCVYGECNGDDLKPVTGLSYRDIQQAELGVATP
jgi:hypothetical protein